MKVCIKSNDYVLMPDTFSNFYIRDLLTYDQEKKVKKQIFKFDYTDVHTHIIILKNKCCNLQRLTRALRPFVIVNIPEG